MCCVAVCVALRVNGWTTARALRGSGGKTAAAWRRARRVLRVARGHDVTCARDGVLAWRRAARWRRGGVASNISRSSAWRGAARRRAFASWRLRNAIRHGARGGNTTSIACRIARRRAVAALLRACLAVTAVQQHNVPAWLWRACRLATPRARTFAAVTPPRKIIQNRQASAQLEFYKWHTYHARCNNHQLWQEHLIINNRICGMIPLWNLCYAAFNRRNRYVARLTITPLR